MNLATTASKLKQGQTALGIELGSTRIKCVLIDDGSETIATGSYTWENKFEDGIWTYSLDEVWEGIQQAYRELATKIWGIYHVPLENIGSIGISAMMHGYLAFDKDEQLLVPFRTWRNNITQQAADELTKAFNFNIPQRWSIAHLYQAILNQEEHVAKINFLTTLAGYVHWRLTGEKVLGIGDASGMFPIDVSTKDYDKNKLSTFNELVAAKNYPWNLVDILPKPLLAGSNAGTLTKEGAKLLDPTQTLQAGSLLAPPEGDAGTGMVSTNSVRVHTGNISVGTSAFSMNVLEHPLKQVYRDIDIVTTPAGLPVAMVHTNNCSSDINAWAKIFAEFAKCLGVNISPDKLYETLFTQSAKARPDAGGLVNYSYLSGENITQIQKGRPLFVRTESSDFDLPDFFLSQLYGAFAPLKLGMDTLFNEEKIKTRVMIAQGGLFKTPVIGQQILANDLDLPIMVMKTADTGGPWGMALLALYAKSGTELSLEEYLDKKVFKQVESMTLLPEKDGVKGYAKYIKRYQAGLAVEALAGEKFE